MQTLATIDAVVYAAFGAVLGFWLYAPGAGFQGCVRRQRKRQYTAAAAFGAALAATRICLPYAGKRIALRRLTAATGSEMVTLGPAGNNA